MSGQRVDILRLGLGLDDDPWADEPVAPLRTRASS